MTNGNKKFGYFCLGVLTGIVGVAIYQIFGKPVLPTNSHQTTDKQPKEGEVDKRDEWTEYVKSLSAPRSLDDVVHIPLIDHLSDHLHTIEPTEPEKAKWESRGSALGDANSLSDLDDTKPIKLRDTPDEWVREVTPESEE